MSQYVLDHHLEGEKQRLALMSQLLDPMHRQYIESLGISLKARVLEVGCGNGSMSAWLAQQVAPEGQIIDCGLFQGCKKSEALNRPANDSESQTRRGAAPSMMSELEP
jgi:precorrin-6B methylase 2